MEKYVAYYRVSTHKQGADGYGIDGQKEMVMNFLSSVNGKLIDTFTEVESGKVDNRVELDKAIRICRVQKAKLVVSKLDRLSRDVAFIASLMKSDVAFVVAEMPEMTNLTIHIFAAMAEHELKLISERTKKGLEQAKKRGVVLGNPCFKKGAQVDGSGNMTNALKVKNENCKKFRVDMRGIISDIKTENLSERISLQGMADILNDRGFQTQRGKRFSKMTVKRIMD